MMSMRSFARAAPRTLSRLSAVRAAVPARTTTASFLLKTQPSFARASAARAAFSTSVSRRAPAGETDGELVAKLQSEIEFETEVKQNESEPASIKDFLENGPFKLEDTAGNENVVLTRTFGNEKITVSFSIADLTAYDDAAYQDDPALADEDDGDMDALAQGGRQSAQGDEAADEFEGEDETDPNVPCRLNVVVEKPGKGALSIEATAQQGQVSVENVFFYKDAALAHAATAEASQAAQKVYPGPPFGTLDENLQVLLERYLEERGVTQALAVFVPEYMDVKEQREYLDWLNNVKSFIEA